MPQAGKLTDTTFKPVPDKWIAKEGTDVVLRSSQSEVVLLMFRGGRWLVTSHSASDLTGDAVFDWCGSRFVREGRTVDELTEQAGPDAWERLYREVASVWTSPPSPMERIRNPEPRTPTDRSLAGCS